MERLARPCLFLIFAAIPARADPPPPTTSAPLQLEQEVIVKGWRYTEPSFQEQYDYHREEHRRLKQKFEQPPPPVCLYEMPLTRADTGGPTLQLGCMSEKGSYGLVIRF